MQDKKNDAMLKLNARLASEKRVLTKQLESAEIKSNTFKHQKDVTQEKLSHLERKVAWVSVKIGGIRK